MSFDLTIKSDDTYSRSTPKPALEAFIASLPHVVRNGTRGFVLDDRPTRWMEIDLEVVSEDGDNIEESGKVYDSINCVCLHIPYGFLGDTIESSYLPTAFAIADHIGWTLHDDQSGEPVQRSAAPREDRKPWWRFW